MYSISTVTDIFVSVERQYAALKELAIISAPHKEDEVEESLRERCLNASELRNSWSVFLQDLVYLRLRYVPFYMTAGAYPPGPLRRPPAPPAAVGIVIEEDTFPPVWAAPVTPLTAWPAATDAE